MSYRALYIENAPVRKLDDGTFEKGVLAVFTTRIRGEVSQAAIPLPQAWWDQHRSECREVARKMATQVFVGMKASYDSP